MDYENAPAHLISPLLVDTNIDYALDMSKFPGLDSAECMKEMALLPTVVSAMEVPRVCSLCGNLLPYNTNNEQPCGFCIAYGLLECENEENEETELFSLIASCDLELDDSSDEQSTTELQSVLEDIISASSSSTDISDSLGAPVPKLSPLSPLPSPNLDSMLKCPPTTISTFSVNSPVMCEREVPSLDKLNVTLEDVFIDTTAVVEDLLSEKTLFSPTVVDVSCRKRKLSPNSDTSLRKRPKAIDEIEDVLLNCFGDFGHYYNSVSNEVMTRFS